VPAKVPLRTTRCKVGKEVRNPGRLLNTRLRIRASALPVREQVLITSRSAIRRSARREDRTSLREMAVDGKQGFNDIPEMIPGVSVVLLLL
jgi:hypothetical protein